jgi:hypothetical protein
MVLFSSGSRSRGRCQKIDRGLYPLFTLTAYNQFAKRYPTGASSYKESFYELPSNIQGRSGNSGFCYAVETENLQKYWEKKGFFT